MLWQTIRAYFLPSAHPGLQPVKDREGEEFRPKRDEYGKRVEEGEKGSVWDSHEADRQRARNRAVVRPHMHIYMRRWGGLGLLLWGSSELCHWIGQPLLSWSLFIGAWLAFVMVFLLFLLRQEVSQ